MERTPLSATRVLMRAGPYAVALYRTDVDIERPLVVEHPDPLTPAQAIEVVGQLRELATTIAWACSVEQESKGREELLRHCEYLLVASRGVADHDIPSRESLLDAYGLFRARVADYLRLRS